VIIDSWNTNTNTNQNTNTNVNVNTNTNINVNRNKNINVAQLIDNTLTLAGALRLPPQVAVDGPSLFIPCEPVSESEPIDVASCSGVMLSCSSGGEETEEDAASAAAGGSVLSVEDPGQVAPVALRTRYLRVANIYSEDVTLAVRYYAPTTDGAWAWLPSEPGAEGGNTLSLTLTPGQAVDVYDGDWRLHARQVCIWGKSASGKKEWNTFQTDGLQLVSTSADQVDEHGDPYYMAAETETVNFTVK
jgi:hypothetical protein